MRASCLIEVWVSEPNWWRRLLQPYFPDSLSIFPLPFYLFSSSRPTRCTVSQGPATFPRWRAVTAALTPSWEVAFGPTSPSATTALRCSPLARWWGPFHPTKCPSKRSTLKVRVHKGCSHQKQCVFSSVLILIDCLASLSDVTPPLTAAYLEVTDLNSKKLKYIPIPRWLQTTFNNEMPQHTMFLFDLYANLLIRNKEIYFFFHMQAYVGVPLHQLVDQSVWVGCGHSPSCFWRRGHCGHGWIRATLGDGFGHPAAIPDGVAEHDWHRRWQTCAGIVGNLMSKFSLYEKHMVKRGDWGDVCLKISTDFF